MKSSLLLDAISSSQDFKSLDDAEWDQLISEARGAGLLGRLDKCAGAAFAADPPPKKALELIQAGKVLAADHERTVRWEINRISRALRDIGSPVILLKGAAYLLAGLPASHGRLYADVDVLVPRPSLDEVEQALLHAGWEGMTPNDYDQHYYRRWMHELPPLIHRERRTVVDVHHTILPVTGRVRLNSQLLFDDSRPLPGSPFRVLSSIDMVLHSAAHMFQDGELHGALRNLLDLDDLLRHFSADSGFWDRLVPRAMQLNLQRPLFYALRYTGQLLQTPIPLQVANAASIGRPSGFALKWMDAMVPYALVPKNSGPDAWRSGLAIVSLYLRSHWLKMPPWLLLRHFIHKSLRNRQSK